MTQTTPQPLTDAHLILAGRYDAERVIELFVGTTAQAEARCAEMSRTASLVLGTDYDTDEHEVHYGGTAPVVYAAPAEPQSPADAVRQLRQVADIFDYAELDRERAEQLAADLARAAQSLHELSATEPVVADARGVMLKVMSVLSAASQGLDLEKETC